MADTQMTDAAIGRSAGGGWDIDLIADAYRAQMGERLAKLKGAKLIASWTGGTMGMMTVVRVLEPELFDKIQALKAEQAQQVAGR